MLPLYPSYHGDVVVLREWDIPAQVLRTRDADVGDIWLALIWD